MNTKVIFNTRKSLKEAVMRKAKRQGLTMSSVLNLAAQAYVDGDIVLSTFERDLAEGIADMKAGRVTPLKDAMKELGIKL